MVYLAAFIVGALLSLSGAVLQSTLRNPLAEPYMLGMVGGGALFSALAMNLGLVAWGAFVLPLASLLGSLFSLALVSLVAWGAERARNLNGADAALRASSSTIVVAGFVVGGFTGSLDMLVLSYAEAKAFAQLSKWLYGSLNTVSGVHLLVGMVTLVLVLAILLRFRRELNVMELGRDEAECLGINTRLVMLVVIGTVALATSISVALAGAIGFIGLVVPHVARRICGPRMERFLPLSALLGGLTLLLAQRLASLLPGTQSIGVGVVCAILGAPFFLYLLASRHNHEARDI